MRAGMALLFLLVACSSQQASADPDAASDAKRDAESIGTVDGTAFIVRSASAMFWTGASTYFMGIGLTTEPGTQCGPVHANGWALALYLNGEPSPITTTTYAINATSADGGNVGDVDVCLHGYGQSCTALPVPWDAALACTGSPGSNGSGTITLTSLSPRVTGSFDVTLYGVHLAGAIDAIVCAFDGGVNLDNCH